MQTMTTSQLSLVRSSLIAVLLVFPIEARAEANEDNAEVPRLLQEARDHAAELSRDADEMEAMTRTDANWESHASMLETIRENVNALTRVTEQLQAKGSAASPWQQQATDRMMPLLKELATNTTAAINHLKITSCVRPQAPMPRVSSRMPKPPTLCLPLCVTTRHGKNWTSWNRGWRFPPISTQKTLR
jgi:hypothetical protein